MHKKRVTFIAAALCLVFMGALAWLWPEKTSAPQQSKAAGVIVTENFFAQNLWEKNLPEGSSILYCGSPASRGGAYPYDPPFPVKSVRLWGPPRTMWSQIEKPNNTYDWRCLDYALSRASSMGADVIYTFGGVPLWANGTNTPTPSCGKTATNPNGNPAGDSYGCAGVPANATARAKFLSDWKEFVNAVVAHSNGKITYWEMWNEPDSAMFWQGPNGYPQLGTPEDLAEMSAIAIGVIKTANPNAKIISPSPAARDAKATAWIKSYLTALSARGKTVDIIGFHGYTIRNNEDALGTATNRNKLEESLINLVTSLRTVSGAKPLFMTEGSWTTDLAITDVNARNVFTAKALTIYASMGIPRYYWYMFAGLPPTSQTNLNARWGTLSDINTPLNSTGVVYQNVRKWLAGATITRECYKDTNQTWRCPITRPSPAGYVGEVIWNSTKNISIAKGSYKTKYDLTGTKTAIGTAFTATIVPVLVDNQSIPPPPPPAPTPPVITSFSASPATITVGQTTTFSWVTSNTTGCSITPGGPTNITTKTWAPITYTTTGVRTYTLTCKNSANATVTRNGSVTVNAPATKPSNVVLSANKTSVTGTSQVTLTLSSVGSTSCKLDPGARVVTGGSIAVTITATTTFMATCSNAVGSTASNSVKVTFNNSPPATLPDPTISKFTATPSSISSGETTNLTWASVDASSCTIASSVDAVAKPYPVSGTLTTAGLTGPVSYTLTCKNAQNKTAFKQLQVTVAGKTTAAPAAAKADAIPSPQPSNTANNRLVYAAPTGQTVVDGQNSSTVLRGQLLSLDITTVNDPAKAATISRAEFYDGETLVQTVEAVPFALDTNKLSVGGHSLTQRTYYKDGSSSSQSQLVEVLGAETVNGAKAGTVSQKSGGLVVIIGILVALAALGAVGFVLLRRRALKQQALNAHVNDYDILHPPTALEQPVYQVPTMPQLPNNPSQPAATPPEQPVQIIRPTIPPDNDSQPPQNQQ